MKIKRLPATFGLGIVWDGFTHALVVSFLMLCLKFSWPRVGDCKFCGHGPDKHAARRDHGMLEWLCNQKTRAAGSSVVTPCECRNYEPERA